MRTLIAVLLLTGGAAAAEPLKLAKVLQGFRGTTFDGRWGMTTENNAVGIWDLKLGRQVGAVDVPVEATRSDINDGQATRVIVYSVSADGRLVLVSSLTTYWKTESNERKAWGASKLYLMSVADGKVLATIAELRKSSCNRNYAITAHCPKFESSSFSSDGTKIMTSALAETVWEKTRESEPQSYQGVVTGWSKGVHKERHEMIVTDLAGKVLARQGYEAYRDDSQGISNWVYPNGVPYTSGFLADGRPGQLFVDAAGCRVKDFAGKPVSFLVDCSPERGPIFQGGKAVSSTGGFTVWDTLTGAALTNTGVASGASYAVSLDLTGWAETTYTEKATTATVKVFDAATGKAVLERVIAVAAGFRQDYNVYDRGNDLFLTKSFDAESNSTMTRFALGAAPSAPLAPVVVAEAAPAGPDIETPPATKTKLDPDAVAVVIGIEKYRQEGVPVVDYAERDAQAMHGYLTRSMGFDPKNVMLLTNERATKTDLEKYLGKWLSNRVTAKSRVFVYYAGHGSPNPTTGDAYLMPYEADPAYLEETALPLSRVYAALEKLPTKDVSVVLDACFSGQGGRSLLAKGVRPLCDEGRRPRATASCWRRPVRRRAPATLPCDTAC